jgi:hypothetical protein
LVIGKATRSSRTRLVRQTGNAILPKAFTPFSHRLERNTKFIRHLGVASSAIRLENDAGALRKLSRDSAAARHPFKRRTLICA